MAIHFSPAVLLRMLRDVRQQAARVSYHLGDAGYNVSDMIEVDHALQHAIENFPAPPPVTPVEGP